MGPRRGYAQVMNSPDSPPRWVRQLAEDEAVWTAYERRRAMRDLLGKRGRLTELASEHGARLDWLDAEQEIGRVVEAQGHWSDAAR